ncbi:MAG: YARHG domain-containing protein [Bacteroidales bacterium]
MKKFILLCFWFCSIITQYLSAQNISVNQFKVGDKIDERFTAFKLADYQNAEPKFEIKFIDKLTDINIICFYRDLGATAIMNMEEIHIYLVKNNKIIFERGESFGRENNPIFEAFYDVFFQYIELKHEWKESDEGSMGYDKAKDFTDGLRFVLSNDKLIPLSELSKTELRIYRNLIFARYGYVFKSKDLNDYFMATYWYKPNPNVKINEIMTARDKELSNYILQIESNKK